MDDNHYTFDEYSKMKDFDRRLLEHESRKNHPAGKSVSPELSEEAKTYMGTNVVKFFFITIPLAALFAVLAVQPLFEAAWGIDLGFWTAFFVLAALRWLIPRPRRRILMEEFSTKKGR